MNLTVDARLVDDISAPAADAARSINKITTAVDRLAKRATAMTERFAAMSAATRKLAEAANALHAAESKTLRGSIDGIASASRQATPVVGRLTAGITRLGTRAGVATRAVEGLATATSSLSPGAVERVNAALAEQVRLMREAASLSKRAGSLAGGGRRGLMARGSGEGSDGLPGLAVALQPQAGGALRSMWTQATSLQDAIVRMHLNGLSDPDIARVRAKAEEVARLNKGTNPLTNLNAIMEARLALGGDLDDALATAGEMSKMRTTLAFSLGADRAKKAEDETYDALRAAELRGVINDPARRAALFKGITASAIVSNGRIDPKAWHKNILYGRSATQGLSDDFVNERFPFLMQELSTGGRGGPAGVALQSLFRSLALSVGQVKNVGEWRKLGLLDESKVEKRDGKDVAVKPGAVMLDLANPDRAIFKLMDRMHEREGIDLNNRLAVITKFAELVGTGTGQTAVDVLGPQRKRLENFSRTLAMVEDSDTLFAQINTTATQSTANLKARIDELSGNLGSVFLPALTRATDGLDGLVGVVNRLAAIGGGNGDDPIGRDRAGGGLALAGLGAWGGAALLRRFPLLQRLAGMSLGGAVGGTWGALAGGSGPASRVLSRTLAAVAAPEVGIALAGSFAQSSMDRFAHWTGTDRFKSYLRGPEVAERSAGWQWGARARNLAFGSFSDAWHALTRWGGPIDGKRATGGPVGAGRTYLVGERGPELFTPGTSGAITSNDALTGNAREMRHVGYAIVSSLDDMTARVVRAIEKNRLGGHGGGSTPGSGEGGGGTFYGGGGGSTPGGGHAGGRRAFMARHGHFGGRFAKEFAPGGRRVGREAMRGRMGRLKDWQNKYAEESYNFWRSKGATHDQALAMLGNEQVESGFNPNSRGDGGSAHGIMQWHGDRRRAIFRGTGIDIDRATHRQQLEAAYYEMTKGGEQAGGRRFFGARSLEEAESALVNFYERPADRRGNVIARSKLGRAWGQHFSGTGKPIDDKPQAQVPKVLSDNVSAAKVAEERRASAKAQPTHTTTNHVTLNVHAQPHHDSKDIAAAVHERFNDAVRSQLNDGAWG